MQGIILYEVEFSGLPSKLLKNLPKATISISNTT